MRAQFKIGAKVVHSETGCKAEIVRPRYVAARNQGKDHIEYVDVVIVNGNVRSTRTWRADKVRYMKGGIRG
jgi:hypothetical protein